MTILRSIINVGVYIARQIYVPIMRHDIKLADLPSAPLIKESAILSKIAYEDNLCKKYNHKECTVIPKPSPSLKPLRFYDGKPSEDAQAYLWIDDQNPHRIFIAFRGTSSLSDVLADIDVRMVSVPKLGNDVKVHQGFYRQFDVLKKQIWKHIDGRGDQVTEVVFCGHSLGAALATVASAVFASEHPYRYKTKCFTVGSPRVGNAAFRSVFQEKVFEHYRIFNENDPVSMIPISHRFEHTDNGICIADDGQTQMVVRDDPWFIRPWTHSTDFDIASPIRDHDCQLYIQRIDQETCAFIDKP